MIWELLNYILENLLSLLELHFQSDIHNKKEYDEEGNELDKHGFKVKKYPDGLGSVRVAVENCEQLCGLDKKVMESLLKGEWTHHTTYNSMGRQSKKIVIEYDITEKSK